MSTNTVPPTMTIDEWCTPLRWHPDLARDLRACRARIASERRSKRLWLRDIPTGRWSAKAAEKWPGKPPPPMPTAHNYPAEMAATWLRLRYEALWASAPTLPVLVIGHALDAAVEAGAWVAAIAVIQQAMAGDGERRRRAGSVHADVFNDVTNVRPPDWVAKVRSSAKVEALLRTGGGWAEDMPPFPAILLTISPDATWPETMEALKGAWKTVKPTLDPQVGTRPGKQARGHHPEFAQNVILYRLWRQWENRARRHGGKAKRTTFTEALSACTLPLQQPRARALLRTRTALPPDVIAWLETDDTSSPPYLAKRLREVVLPRLKPDKHVGTLQAFLEKTPIKSDAI